MALPDGFRGIDDLTLAHQRVLIRVDFDVPLRDDGEVTNDRKLRAALPTLQKAIKEGARVVLATHLGSAEAPPRSIEPVAAKLAELLGQEVYLPDECVGDAARKVVSDLREGQVCLLENLRFLPEEARSDEAVARKLLALCDAYVYEAFGASHLTLASTVTLPRLVKSRALGYGVQAELEGLGHASSNAYKPFVGVLGGSSLSRSVPALEVMLRRCEAVLVGGAVANTLLAARSVDVKESVHEREQLALARALLTRARDAKVEIVLPVDVVTGSSPTSAEAFPYSVGVIPAGSGAYDIGPRTAETFRARIQKAKTVWWHGALGVLENPAFSRGSSEVMDALAEAPAFGVVTGESVAELCAAAGAEVEKSIGFVSTGGSASLAFIEGKRLPGIEALRG